MSGCCCCGDSIKKNPNGQSASRSGSPFQDSWDNDDAFSDFQEYDEAAYGQFGTETDSMLDMFASMMGGADAGAGSEAPSDGDLAPPSAGPADGIRACNVLVIGINYYQIPNAQLNGCVNDVKTSLKTLNSLFKFQINRVYIGVENPDEVPGYPEAEFFEPTKDNVELYLQKVVTECPPDEFVWFHYSGHGCSVQDMDGDESDGMDEGIMCCDRGFIPDDYLNRTVLNSNNELCMVAFMDCCHSGTIWDLKLNHPGKVVAFSGCMDNQFSNDVVAPGQGPFGAFTNCMSRVMMETHKDGKNMLDVTFIEVRDGIRENMKQMGFQQRTMITRTKKELKCLRDIVTL